MSLRPSRIHRARNLGAWQNQFHTEGDLCPSELPRLPVWTDDEEADDWPPGEAQGAGAVTSLLRPCRAWRSAAMRFP